MTATVLIKCFWLNDNDVIYLYIYIALRDDYCNNDRFTVSITSARGSIATIARPDRIAFCAQFKEHSANDAFPRSQTSVHEGINYMV